MARREMFQSNNPVFTRSEGFAQGAQGARAGYAGYGSPSTWGTGAGSSAPSGEASYAGTGYGTPPTHTTGDQGRMTIDSVVQKTALTLLLVVVAGAATWALTPPLDGQAATTLYAVTVVSALVGMGLGIWAQVKRVISPTLVIAYALVEGVFVGGLSKTFGAYAGNGIIPQAVLGTVAALAGTLAAYKIFDIKVGDKFRKGMAAAGMGFIALIVLDLVLGLFGNAIGFNGLGTLGLLFGVALLIFGVFSLVMDFDFIERGIDAQLPERESWRAALGLTVSLILIYVQLLRILAILRGD